MATCTPAMDLATLKCILQHSSCKALAMTLALPCNSRLDVVIPWEQGNHILLESASLPSNCPVHSFELDMSGDYWTLHLNTLSCQACICAENWQRQGSWLWFWQTPLLFDPGLGIFIFIQARACALQHASELESLNCRLCCRPSVGLLPQRSQQQWACLGQE